jgi:ABC-type multidrug transport system fused ATPase/permease subunit
MEYCDGPLWFRDDLNPCFQMLSVFQTGCLEVFPDKFDSYLETIFPLTACGLSVLLVLFTLFSNRTKSKKHTREQDLLLDVEAEDTDEDSEVDLTLQKTTSRTNLSIREVDKPTGEVLLVVVELIALFGQLSLSALSLFVDQHEIPRTVSIANIVTWLYIVVLASIRLLSTTTTWRLSYLKLWNHTAMLYGAQWLFEVAIFRSSIIHPRGTTRWIFPIVHFSLTSLLLTIAVVSRKGNKAVVLEYEEGLEPSQEPLASLFSIATFAWADPIIWRGYKKTLELSDVWNLPLKDKAATVLTSFRQVKKTHMLAFRLLLFFKRRILLQGAWAALGSVFMFLPTLLLKAILEYLEDPADTPRNAAWLYVILLLVTGLVQAVADGQALWIGRRVCIRLRAIIVGELYSKALRRKAAASTEKEEEKKPEDKSAKPLLKRVQTGFQNASKKMMFLSKKDKAAPMKEPVPASNGTIINLMSIDSFKVADISAYLHFLWACVPVQLAMAIGLLYSILGYSSFVGIGLMVLILPLNFLLAKSFQAAQKKIMAATDVRIHATNEVLQNVRIIKYFAWEERFYNNVSDKRRIELRALRRKYILWSSAATIWSGVPILITFMSFLIYTLVEKKPLVPSIAFPALSMFSLLRIPLDQLADMVAHIQESKVSVDRVEDFMNEEETDKYIQLRDSRTDDIEPRIAIQDATLTWGAKPSLQKTDSTAGSFRLININVEFMIGDLNIIAGPTGSGKTSLLMALLGEMKLVEGHIFIPGGSVRQELRPDPSTGLTESVAYCAQQPWLVNDTIKENILFASPFDQGRYTAVLVACALERDLEILDAGDQTLVGEKGIALSGGQKQRISLARAMYCNSKHLMLDDVLSAVDSHTAKHIFDNAIMGPLMAHRTCILVTHNVTLTALRASYVVLLDNGKVAAQGDPEQIIKSGALGEDILKSRPVSRVASVVPSRVPSDDNIAKNIVGNEEVEGAANGGIDHPGKTDQNPKMPIDTRIETKAEGSVKWATIKVYLKALGPWYFWIFALLAFVATQVGSVATNVWIRQWANSYRTSNVDNKHAAVNGLHISAHSGMSSLHQNTFMVMPQTHANRSCTTVNSEEMQIVDVKYYLSVYALLGITYVAICFGREILFFWASLQASRKFHDRLLNNVLRAKFNFFDSTPLGQLMNRFSKDVQAIDQEVAPIAIGMFHSLFSIVTIVILISAITPGFLIAGVFISGLYFATGFLYIRSSRDLKRIEAVQRSPLFQHFGETLSGIVTIRAYGDESRFISDSSKKINTYNRPFIYLWATNRWLAFRVDVAGALVAFASGLFVIINVGRIDAGAAGLALSYAITFTENVLWLVRLYAANEQNMNAVERVLEYVNVEQEAKAHIPETKPAASWPSQGVVEFIDYSTRYRVDLEPVLRELTFKIEAGQKVGIVGRTGAGKSSLALAIFRGLEADTGKILIDREEIGLLGLQDLREAITIVPQDPTLFTGTLRSNLDPFELFTDEEIFTALRRVQLISGTSPSDDSGKSTPEPHSNGSTLKLQLPPKQKADSDEERSNGTVSSGATLVTHMAKTHHNKNMFYDLQSPIAESGSNLSQGQRQLLCLARALLKSPKILVMDEATASIDYATDSKIQETLRELKGNTIITIAHRLQTIVDYDKVLVLDKGEVIEYADPWELIRKEGGMFRGMCETSGDFDTLMDLAKKAWEGRRLVDDS